MADFYERIVQLKNDRNLLQKDIAKGSGISLRSYQYYEKHARTPDIDTLIKLCRYFNVSADYLLGLSDNPESLYPSNVNHTNISNDPKHR